MSELGAAWVLPPRSKRALAGTGMAAFILGPTQAALLQCHGCSRESPLLLPREQSSGAAATASRARNREHGSAAAVARESSRAGVRDECFAVDADRVDRNYGDRFGDGASRSMVSQLTRSTLAIHAFRSQAWPRRDHRTWAQGRSIPSEKR